MRCVCGRYMRKISEHLNYVVWKCSRCNHRKVLWKDTDPWNQKPVPTKPNLPKPNPSKPKPRKPKPFKPNPRKPIETKMTVDEDYRFYLGEVLKEVVENLYRENPRSYDEWEEDIMVGGKVT